MTILKNLGFGIGRCAKYFKNRVRVCGISHRNSVLGLWLGFDTRKNTKDQTHFTSLANLRACVSTSSGVTEFERINSRYRKVTDVFGSRVKFSFSLPLLK